MSYKYTMDMAIAEAGGDQILAKELYDANNPPGENDPHNIVEFPNPEWGPPTSQGGSPTININIPDRSFSERFWGSKEKQPSRSFSHDVYDPEARPPTKRAIEEEERIEKAKGSFWPQPDHIKEAQEKRKEWYRDPTGGIHPTKRVDPTGPMGVGTGTTKEGEWEYDQRKDPTSEWYQKPPVSPFEEAVKPKIPKPKRRAPSGLEKQFDFGETITTSPMSMAGYIGPGIINEASRTGKTWWEVTAEKAYTDPLNWRVDEATGEWVPKLSVNEVNAIVFTEANNLMRTSEQTQYQRGVQERDFGLREKEYNRRARSDRNSITKFLMNHQEQKKNGTANRAKIYSYLKSLKAAKSSTAKQAILKAIKEDPAFKIYNTSMVNSVLWGQKQYDKKVTDEEIAAIVDERDPGRRSQMLRRQREKRQGWIDIGAYNLGSTAAYLGDDRFPDMDPTQALAHAQVMIGLEYLARASSNPTLNAMLVEEGIGDDVSANAKFLWDELVGIDLIGKKKSQGRKTR